MPQVVEIVGEGTNRYITLTHREQIKRFASDLIKVVKSQPGKKLKLSQFARAYEQVLGRTFRVEDYGTNNINVLLAEIWEGTINIMPIKREFVDQSITGPLYVNTANKDEPTKSPMIKQLVASNDSLNKPYLTDQYPDAWFEIPKRERSDKEIKRTKYFVLDVIELLSNIEPDHSVPFSKFIPSYHYYFNRQCKVSIFGFSKLIDLFESISPDVVEIIDQGPGEEKIIKLAKQHVKKIVHSSSSSRDNNNHCHQRRVSHHEHDDDDEEELEDEDDEEREVEEAEEEEEEEEDDDEQEEEDDDDYLPADDNSQVIDNGPTEEELIELEDEFEAYEEYKAIQSKRSSRMAAILDIFKYSIY